MEGNWERKNKKKKINESGEKQNDKQNKKQSEQKIRMRAIKNRTDGKVMRQRAGWPRIRLVWPEKKKRVTIITAGEVCFPFTLRKGQTWQNDED